MHAPPPLHLADYVGPAAGALVFILIMSLVPEPGRRRYNAIFVAGASGAYLSGGLGLWELPFPALAGGVVAYLGLRSHLLHRRLFPRASSTLRRGDRVSISHTAGHGRAL